jgi:hypothetical protein
VEWPDAICTSVETGSGAPAFGASLNRLVPSSRESTLSHTDCGSLCSDCPVFDAFVWPGNSARYINFLRGFSLDSWSVFLGVDVVESLENEECVFSDGLCCVCSGSDLLSWDVIGVGRAGSGGGFHRECAVAGGAGVGRMEAGDGSSGTFLVRSCVFVGVGVGRLGATGGGCGGCARSGRGVCSVVGSLAVGARTENGSDRSITGGGCAGCGRTVLCRFAGLDVSGVSTGRGGVRSEGDLSRSIGVRLIPKRSFKDRDDCEDGCDDRAGKFLVCDCDGCDGEV